jgi:hypothetical protein
MGRAVSGKLPRRVEFPGPFAAGAEYIPGTRAPVPAAPQIGTVERPDRPVRVQASTVRMRDAYVEHHFGIEGRQKFRQAASSALRNLVVTTAQPKAGWVAFDLFIEATVLVDRLFGNGDLELAWDIGKFASNHAVGVWKRLIMRHVRPATLLGLTAGVWSHHYEGGRLISRSLGTHGLYITIAEFPQPHRAHCLSVGGWMAGSLVMGPRRNTQVRELSCRARGEPTCDFQLTWED